MNDLAVEETHQQLLVAAGDGEHLGSVEVWSMADSRQTARITTERAIEVLAAADANVVVTGDFYGGVSKWDTRRCQSQAVWLLPRCDPLWTVQLHHGRVTAIAVSADGKYVFSGGSDGLIKVLRIEDGVTLLTLSIDGPHWYVIAPDGRFDTDDLDSVPNLHWAVADDPFHPLAPDTFFRDYFQPKLLSLTLAGDTQGVVFRPVSKLQDLNRAAPIVGEPTVTDRNADGSVDVSIKVSEGSYGAQGGSGTHQSDTTDAYDLRLFRDGQLVDSIPHPRADTPDGPSPQELLRWQQDMQVEPRNDQRIVAHDGYRTATFKGVRLPQSLDTNSSVQLTAYAFNSDRVRSPMAAAAVSRPAGASVRRAFVLSAGINNYGGHDWDLAYAVKDARQVAKFLPATLADHGYRVIQERLVSDRVPAQSDELSATKANILDALRRVSAQSTPDDLVIIFFSGHGFGGARTGLNLLTSDSEPWLTDWRSPSATDLAKTISANDLAEILRSINAQEVVIIVDACHAAAAIASGAWRPGPLGNQGLGQLAYDKRMEVLAASQTSEAARELGGSISEGVLTYALIHDGLRARKGTAGDGKITIRSLLQYAVADVPAVLEAVRNGTLDDYNVPVERDAIPPGHGLACSP